MLRSPRYPESKHIMEDGQNATRFRYTMSDLPSYPTIVDEPNSVPGTSSLTASVDDSVISSRSCTSTSLTDISATPHILQNSHPPALTVPMQSYVSAAAAPLMQQSTDTDQPESKSFACKYSLRSPSKQDLRFLNVFKVHREIRQLIGEYQTTGSQQWQEYHSHGLK